MGKKKKIVETFTVLNDKGLHARPCARIVQCVAMSNSQVSLKHLRDPEAIIANGRSILDIMALGASQGSRIRIEAEGEDAEETVRQILELAGETFGVKY